MRDFISIFGSFFQFNYERDNISELGLTIIVLLGFLIFIVSAHSHIFVFLLLAYYPQLPESKLLSALYYDRMILAAGVTTSVLVLLNIIALFAINMASWFRVRKLWNISEQVNYILSVFRLFFIWNCLIIIVSINIAMLAIFDSKNLNSPLTNLAPSSTFIWSIYLIQWGFVGLIMFIGLNRLFTKSKKKFGVVFILMLCLVFFAGVKNHSMAKNDARIQPLFNAGALFKIYLYTMQPSYVQMKEKLRDLSHANQQCRGTYVLFNKMEKDMEENNLSLWAEDQEALSFMSSECLKSIKRT